MPVPGSGCGTSLRVVRRRRGCCPTWLRLLVSAGPSWPACGPTMLPGAGGMPLARPWLPGTLIRFCWIVLSLPLRPKARSRPPTPSLPKTFWCFSWTRRLRFVPRLNSGVRSCDLSRRSFGARVGVRRLSGVVRGSSGFLLGHRPLFPPPIPRWTPGLTMVWLCRSLTTWTRVALS